MRRLLVLALLGALALPAAAVKDPFPNQPGALSAEEVAAATAAMKMTSGSENLPLVASGKRGLDHMMPGYAVFASPLADFSGGVRTRRQTWCNYFRSTAAWQCTPAHDEFRATAHGIEHVYTYQAAQGAGDRQAAAEIAGYMYSQCFNAHFAAIGGKPFTPASETDYVSVVLDDGKGFNVMTGYQGPGGGPVNTFRLEKTDRKADGCGFTMVYARMASTGVVIPERQARILEEQSKQAAKEFEQQQAEQSKQAAKAFGRQQAEEQARQQAADPGERYAASKRAEMMMLAAMIVGLAALVLPWFGLFHSRRAAAIVAGVLAGACTFLLVATDQGAVRGNIRIDLIIGPVLALVAWGICIMLATWASREQPAEPFAGGMLEQPGTPAVPPPAKSAIPTWLVIVLGIAASVALALILIFAAPSLISLLW